MMYVIFWLYGNWYWCLYCIWVLIKFVYVFSDFGVYYYIVFYCRLVSNYILNNINFMKSEWVYIGDE